MNTTDNTTTQPQPLNTLLIRKVLDACRAQAVSYARAWEDITGQPMRVDNADSYIQARHMLQDMAALHERRWLEVRIRTMPANSDAVRFSAWQRRLFDALALIEAEVQS